VPVLCQACALRGGHGRILVGVGRVKQVGKLSPYLQEGEGMPGMVWERPVQHSIRPKGKDGFLMPYVELLARSAADPGLDLERYTAHAPEEHWDEFSYASELVTHDGAIAALLSLDTALGRIETELGIAAGWQREWLHTELARLWKVRGPYPGLGPVLTAFGLARGVFVAHAVQQKAGDNADPWPVVDDVFKNPAAHLPQALRHDVKELAPTWKALPPERRAYLKLLSRFEVSVEQASNLYDAGARGKQSWVATDKEILGNPYRLYEITRQDPQGVRLLTVDRGVFPDDAVRLLHPLDKPSGLGLGRGLAPSARVHLVCAGEGGRIRAHAAAAAACCGSGSGGAGAAAMPGHRRHARRPRQRHGARDRCGAGQRRRRAAA
jgi:hypothetical protein